MPLLVSAHADLPMSGRVHHDHRLCTSILESIGDAAFFTAAQLLTVSSSMPNPVTGAGRVIDIALEMWSVFVITAVAGSFATFFSSGDS